MDMTDGAGGELPVQTNATGVMSPHKKNELNKEHDSHAAAIAAAQSMLSMTGGGYVDDGVVLKWGQKWKFFVVCTVERAVHNCFKQDILTVDEASGAYKKAPLVPKRRVTLFGSVLQSYIDDVRKTHIYFGGKPRTFLNCVSDFKSKAEEQAEEAKWLAEEQKNEAERLANQAACDAEVEAKLAEEEAEAKEGESGSEAAAAAKVAAAKAAAAKAAAKLSGEDGAEGEVQAKQPARRRRRSMTMEFHAEKDEDIMSALQDLYDPKRQAVGHELYTLQNLLKRESVQWDYRVRTVLDKIWKAIDIDGSGGISKDEYDAMHEQMYYVVHELDQTKKTPEQSNLPRVANLAKRNETEEQKQERLERVRAAAEKREAEEREMKERQQASLQEDWECDSQGYKHLNYQRFTQCWFVMADRFTHTIDAREYAEFLEKVHRMMEEYRARHPEKYHPDFHDQENKKLHDAEGDKKNSKKRTAFIVKKFKSAVKAVLHRVNDWGIQTGIRWGARVLVKKKARGGVDKDCDDTEGIDGYVSQIIKHDNPNYIPNSTDPATMRYLFEYHVRCSDGQEAQNIKPEDLKVMGINSDKALKRKNSKPLGGSPDLVLGTPGSGTPGSTEEDRRALKERRLKAIADRREEERRKHGGASGDWLSNLRGSGAPPPKGKQPPRRSVSEGGPSAGSWEQMQGRRKSSLKEAAAVAGSLAVLRRASQPGANKNKPNKMQSADPEQARRAAEMSKPKVVKNKVARKPVYVLDPDAPPSPANANGPAAAEDGSGSGSGNAAPMMVAQVGQPGGQPQAQAATPQQQMPERNIQTAPVAGTAMTAGQQMQQMQAQMRGGRPMPLGLGGPLVSNSSPLVGNMAMARRASTGGMALRQARAAASAQNNVVAIAGKAAGRGPPKTAPKALQRGGMQRRNTYSQGMRPIPISKSLGGMKLAQARNKGGGLQLAIGGKKAAGNGGMLPPLQAQGFGQRI